MYPIIWLVEIANVSRSGYYKWESTQEKRADRKKQDHYLMEKIKEIHQKRPCFGYLRIQVSLKKEGFHINHKRVYRLMKQMGISSVIRKKRRYFGRKQSVVLPNLINRQFQTEKQNYLYVTDITYIRLGDRFYYLSAIQDLYNNEIVSWRLSNQNGLKLVMDTVEDLAKQRDVHGAILHSDQGSQYTSKEYNARLSQLNIIGSHSRKGNCLDNACIESFFSHMKTETLYFSQCKTEEELYQAVKEYLWFYNHERFQKKLNQCAPVEYRNILIA
jgi:putative transposase